MLDVFIFCCYFDTRKNSSRSLFLVISKKLRKWVAKHWHTQIVKLGVKQNSFNVLMDLENHWKGYAIDAIEENNRKNILIRLLERDCYTGILNLRTSFIFKKKVEDECCSGIAVWYVCFATLHTFADFDWCNFRQDGARPIIIFYCNLTTPLYHSCQIKKKTYIFTLAVKLENTKNSLSYTDKFIKQMFTCDPALLLL